MTVIGNLKFYVPNRKAEAEAEKKVKEIVESRTDITHVSSYDMVAGEMRFTGRLHYDEIRFTWNIHTGEIESSRDVKVYKDKVTVYTCGWGMELINDGFDLPLVWNEDSKSYRQAKRNYKLLVRPEHMIPLNDAGDEFELTNTKSIEFPEGDE